MIKISDGKIGTREFFAVILMTIGIKGTDTTPDLLLFTGKNAAWIIPIISFGVMMIPFLLLLKLIQKNELGLIELIYRLMGRKLGIAAAVVLFLCMFNVLVTNSRSYIDIANTMYYHHTPVSVLFILLMAGCSLIAIRGFETLGRTSWMLIGMMNVIALLLVIFTWRELDWRRLFPIAGPGGNRLAYSGFKQAAIYGEIIFLAAFFPYVRTYTNFRLGSLLGFIGSCLWITVLVAIFVAAFDYPAVEYLNYPYHQLTRMARIGSTNNTHLEAIFLSFWISAAVLHFAIYLYIAAYLFGQAFRIHAFEKLIIPFAVLNVFFGLIPDNVVIINDYRSVMVYITSVVLIVLPLLLWILDRRKGRTAS